MEGSASGQKDSTTRLDVTNLSDGPIVCSLTIRLRGWDPTPGCHGFRLGNPCPGVGGRSTRVPQAEPVAPARPTTGRSGELATVSMSTTERGASRRMKPIVNRLQDSGSSRLRGVTAPSTGSRSGRFRGCVAQAARRWRVGTLDEERGPQDGPGTAAHDHGRRRHGAPAARADHAGSRMTTVSLATRSLVLWKNVSMWGVPRCCFK